MQTVESDSPSFAQTSSLAPGQDLQGRKLEPANKVGTLATCKIASIQQSRVSITLEWIQM